MYHVKSISSENYAVINQSTGQIQSSWPCKVTANQVAKNLNKMIKTRRFKYEDMVIAS